MEELKESKRKRYDHALRELERNLGRFPTTHDILNFARPKSSPIHDHFDWNDTTAAEKWRTHQARLLVCYITEVRRNPAGSRRAWANVEMINDGDTQRVYAQVSEVLRHADLRKQYVEDGMMLLKEFLNKFGKLSEFSTVASYMRKFLNGKAKKRTG